MRADLPDFVEAVLAAVEEVPPGRVVTYGDIAEYLGRGGPRQVGRVLARYGGGVSWWRVIRADGRPAADVQERAWERLVEEDAPVRRGRVDLRRARWWFGADPNRTNLHQ